LEKCYLECDHKLNLLNSFLIFYFININFYEENLMRGKILLSAVALSLSAAAFASGAMPAPEPINYFDGFYVGVAAGIQNLQSEMNAEAHDFAYYDHTVVNYQGVIVEGPTRYYDDPRSTYFSGDMGKSSATGDLFIGYGQTFHPDNMGDGLYAGIEIYGSIGKASPSFNHVTNLYQDTQFDSNGYIISSTPVGVGSSIDQVELENKYAFGALLKGGYLMTPKSMIYIVLGTEYTKFDVNQSHVLVNWLSSDSSNSDWINYGCNSFSEHKWAFVPGLGIETMVSNNWSLRAQYTYAIYPSFSGGNVNAHNTLYSETLVDEGVHHDLGTLTTITKAEFKPRIGKFELGLTYHANGV
jgi:opacity protein-like surface antigen